MAIALAVLLVLPSVIAYSGRRWLISTRRLRWLDRLRIEHDASHSMVWDFAFEDGEPCLMVATLKNGSVIAGYYGPNSHSGYGTRTRDLYLEERWNITTDTDGQVTQLSPIARSVGGGIAADEIACLARYAVDDAQAAELRK